MYIEDVTLGINDRSKALIRFVGIVTRSEVGYLNVKYININLIDSSCRQWFYDIHCSYANSNQKVMRLPTTSS